MGIVKEKPFTSENRVKCASEKLSERQLIKVWQHQLLDKDGLTTEGGEPISVIYPGRPNDDRGPDFRDAVLATGSGMVKGDIEVHIRSSGWQEHGHHRDANYNRVILHVVMWHNTRAATRLQNGGDAPVLVLEKFLTFAPERLPAGEGIPDASSRLNMPCYRIARRLKGSTLTKSLNSAGEERFFAKIAGFRKDLGRMDAGQSLYQGIMIALGYSRNRLPFLELSRRVPLRFLEETQYGESSTDWLSRRQVLLLATAGLLPTQGGLDYPGNGKKNKLTEELSLSFSGTRVMSSDDWQLFKVRPNNSPVYRLVALSHLLLRYRKTGLFNGLVNLVDEVPLNRGYRKLEEGIMVRIGGNGTRILQRLQSRMKDLTLLGKGRAAEIIVNVILPFCYARGKVISRPELSRKALELYHSYPRLPLNSVERHMTEQLGLDCLPGNSARRQQGLIQIYKNLCAQGSCNKCLLGQPEAGHNVQVEAGYPAVPEAEVAAGGNHGGVIGAQFKGRD